MSHRSDKKPNSGAAPLEAAAAPRAVREACFVRENGSAAICSFQTAEGATWMLPLGQLSAAASDADGKTLRLIFAGAEVRLEGSHLEKIGEAIARGHAFRVSAVNPSYKSEYEPEVFVSLVEVTGAKPPGDEADGSASR
jgi:hypothetical protein